MRKKFESLRKMSDKMEPVVGIGLTNPSASSSKSIVYVIADLLTIKWLRLLSSGNAR